MQRIPTIYVTESELGGRGVFTYEAISEGALLEICPVLIIPESQVEVIHKTVLHDYYFTWGDTQKQAAIVLGFGSIYNHATLANAKFIMDYEQQSMDFLAIRDIEAGEEITTNYNGLTGDSKPLWFTVKE